MREKNRRALSIIVLGTILIAGLTYVVVRYEPQSWLESLISFIKDEHANPAIFIALMVVLPIVGFPISLFLITAGLKFGLSGGMLVSAAAMPVHLAVSYFLGRYLIDRHVRSLLEKTRYSVPEIPSDKIVPFAAVFFAVPGIPYSLKNLILPLSGISFWPYMGVGVGVQWVMGIPFLGLGGATATMNIYMLSGFFAVLAAGYFFSRWLKRRYGHMVE